MNNNQRIISIREHLKSLQPTHLEIEDESHKHRGHPGAKDGRGHFAITIQAKIFDNKSKIAQHQLIYQALGELMTTDIHALAIKINSN